MGNSNRVNAIRLDYEKYRPAEPILPDPLRDDVEVIIVIPAYKEPDIDEVLQSLSKCPGRDKCEVIIVMNESVLDDRTVIEHHQLQWHQLHVGEDFDGLEVSGIHMTRISKVDAGVGMARRIGMDEAIHRFRHHNKNGIIACLDADCTVAENYLEEIIQAFHSDDKMDALSIHFEHPDLDDPAIVAYELHLRCFIEWQRWLHLPFAFHTVGSSMAVRSEAYRAQGGMNKRKAGEDFYFFHKFTATGRAGVLHSTTVYPSSRQSDRVPFGTGKAVMKIRAGEEQMSYTSSSYLLLLPLLESLNALYKGADWLEMELDDNVVSFFYEQQLGKTLEEIRANTKSYHQFRKRFFQWLNAFRFMKYMHYMRDQGHIDLPVMEAACALYKHVFDKPGEWTSIEFLLDLRMRQKAWQSGS